MVRGLKAGEYRCEKESDLALLAAEQYYTEHGLLDRRKLHTNLSSFLPDHIFKALGDEKLARWEKLIEDAYNKVRYLPSIKSSARPAFFFLTLTRYLHSGFKETGGYSSETSETYNMNF